MSLNNHFCSILEWQNPHDKSLSIITFPIFGQTVFPFLTTSVRKFLYIVMERAGNGFAGTASMNNIFFKENTLFPSHLFYVNGKSNDGQHLCNLATRAEKKTDQSVSDSRTNYLSS